MTNQKFWKSLSAALAVVAATMLFACVAWAASPAFNSAASPAANPAVNKEKKLYSFTGSLDGGRPAADLVFDKAGNLYGTTVTGGNSPNCAAGCGTVFKLTRNSSGQWQETVLYNFQAGADGKNPYGGVTLDSKGNLIGTTVAAGTGGFCSGDGCGVVYKLTHISGGWTQSVLYAFTGGRDGGGPGGAVVLDKAGNIYGTTPTGGIPGACAGQGCGVVYQPVPRSGGGWKENVIHTFTGGKDGATGSLGRLHFDSAGNLYGLAELGGDLLCNAPSGCGAAYQIAPLSTGKWKFSTLYAFKGMPDASFPYGGLISDAAGNLFGTTYFGGANGAGSVFELTRGSNGKWTETLLYNFQGLADGGNPTTTLAWGANGSLYGTTSAGGDANGDGVVFKLTPGSSGWTESIIHKFQNIDGANPNYGLIKGKTGNFFGVTPFGGHGAGVVFQMAP